MNFSKQNAISIKVSATDQALFPIVKSWKIIGILACLQNGIFEREKIQLFLEMFGFALIEDMKNISFCLLDKTSAL